MRITLAMAVACLSLGGLAAAGDATAAIRKSTDIPAQGLGPALTTLAKEFDFQVLYRTEVIGKLRTEGVSGEMTAEEALGHVLSGTGLAYKYLDDKTVTIVPMSTAGSGVSTFQNESSGSSDDVSTKKEAGKKSSQDFRVAQVDQGNGSKSFSVSEKTPASQGNSTGSGGLEEIVVTAQKRLERLMDVPGAVGVLSGETLDSLNVRSLTDIAGYVPGLTLINEGAPGNSQIVIRGISSGYNQTGSSTLVSTAVDNVPVGPTNSGGGGTVVDLAPFDLERVEVLKGPQGTLYGANSMGGIVKYALRKPDLSNFDASLASDSSYVNGSSGVAENVRASVSTPLVENALGVRVTGFYEHDPGYIDNVGIGVKDANTASREGGRASLLWQPLSNLTVEGTYLVEDLNQADETGVTVDPHTLQPLYGAQSRLTNLREPWYTYTRLAYVNLSWDIDFATLASSSSWSNEGGAGGFDLSGGSTTTPNGKNGYSFFYDWFGVEKYTEEVRLTSKPQRALTWMLGFYITKEDSHNNVSWSAYDPARVLLPPAGAILRTVVPVDFRERAVFGNSTYKFTDRWEITGGVRYASNTESTCVEESSGLFGAGSNPCSHRPYQSKATWLGTVGFHVNPDAMLYARVATGTRPGGGCTGCGNKALGTPDFFYPDETVNYEAGLKGEFFDKRLNLDISLYYIDWKNMQILVPARFSEYTANAGAAASSGVELSATYAPFKELQIGANVDYTHAYLRVNAAAAGGATGDQLPGAARWTASVITKYSHPFWNGKSFLLGGDYRYRDWAYNGFSSSTIAGFPALPMAPQNLVGLYTGVTVDRLTARLYGMNVFNNRSYNGVLFIADATKPMLSPTQPRTVGLSLDYRFK